MLGSQKERAIKKSHIGIGAAVVSILMIGILMRYRCDPCGPEKEDGLIVMNLQLSLYHTSVDS